MVILIVIGAFWAFAKRSAPFNVLILGIAFLILGGLGGLPGNILFADRSFFGVMKVIDGPEPGNHVLQHGTTLHGHQDVRVEGACQPLSYFHRNGPIGQVFDRLGSRFGSTTVIGLGTGALACYAKEGQRIDFFEIDSMVERIARDPLLFTYLQNSPGVTSVTIGDGRKLMAEVPSASQDLIIVDAFSSDSVPVHLVTREALRLYVSRLVPDGAIAFHISNRYLDLESVLSATVASEGLSAIANRDTAIHQGEANLGRSPSHWLLVAKGHAELGQVQAKIGWRWLEGGSRTSPWTDDYSNILEALLFSGAKR